MNKNNEDKFDIYQIKSGSVFRDYGFENTENLKARGLKVEYDNYTFIYSDKLEDHMNLEDIFQKFNLYRPEDFKGHSLSVSDVVVLSKDGTSTAHFVDSFGFTEVPEFIQDREQARKSKRSVLSELKVNRDKVEHSKAKINKNKRQDRNER